MSKEKTVKDLTVKELLEDLTHYTNQTQMKCHKSVDNDFAIIRKYIEELHFREGQSKSLKEGKS